MYVTSEFVKKPIEASQYVTRRQRALACECTRELRRCTMEHSIRVSDLKFNERRYHRILRWLEDVKSRHRRATERQTAAVEEKDKQRDRMSSVVATKSPQNDYEFPSSDDKHSKNAPSSVFITQLPKDRKEAVRNNRDTVAVQTEKQNYDILIDSMRKSLRARLNNAEPLLKVKQARHPVTSFKHRAFITTSVDTSKTNFMKNKAAVFLPTLAVPTLHSKSKRHPLRLSAIPEADWKDEQTAIRQNASDLSKKRNNIQQRIKPLKIVTPSSTPRSSRTPALSPISEAPVAEVFVHMKDADKVTEMEEGSESNGEAQECNSTASIDAKTDSNLESDRIGKSKKKRKTKKKSTSKRPSAD